MQVAEEVDNYHIQSPAHPFIKKHHFLLPENARFGSQDICFTLVQHTIAYTKALQHWAKGVHPPGPSQPCCLARTFQELWQAMEPLATFTEGDIFVAMASSPWTEITLPWLMKGVPQESLRSHAQSNRDGLRESPSVAHSEAQPTTTAMWVTAKAEMPTTPPQENHI